jgi:hypothetical protein
MNKEERKRLIIDSNYSIKLIRERRRIVGYVRQRRVGGFPADVVQA